MLILAGLCTCVTGLCMSERLYESATRIECEPHTGA